MPRTYDQQTKDKALELVIQKGTTATAKELGIPLGTVASWASRAGLTALVSNANGRLPTVNGKPSNVGGGIVAIAERQALADVRRRYVESRLDEVIEHAIGLTLDMLANPGDYRVDLHSVVGAWTRAMHDLRLLRGEATEHIAVADAGIDQRLADLLSGKHVSSSEDTTSDLPECTTDGDVGHELGHGGSA